jgi:hypothetical protein
VSYFGNCEHFIDAPADVGGGAPNYSEERCVADNRERPKLLACSFQAGGVRIFDIRDLGNIREVAYFKPGASRTARLPGSGQWDEGDDITFSRVPGYARLYYREATGDHEVWLAEDGNGLMVTRFSDSFKAANPDLFVDWVEDDLP